MTTRHQQQYKAASTETPFHEIPKELASFIVMMASTSLSEASIWLPPLAPLFLYFTILEFDG
jgi:hypothetical protein